MMLATDMALRTDPGFKPYSRKYAESQEAFFKDFSEAFAKLLELGVPEKNFAGKPRMFLKTIEEQEDEAKK